MAVEVMKIIFITLVITPVFCFSQKKAQYKYEDVDSIIQYQDAQVISYKDKSGKQKRDTIWTVTQKKGIEIEFATRVITTDAYLKPRFKIKNK